MSRRPLLVRLSALATGVLASALVAGAAAAVPATTTPETTPPVDAPAAAPDDAPLAITIDSMTPGAVPERGPIRIEGTVTNVSDETWTDINLHPFLNEADAMSSADDLVAAADTDPDAIVGDRITSILDDVDELVPGQSAEFRLRVPGSELTMTQPGVYWFGVHASGQSESSPRDAVADGRARTFLPYLPDPESAVTTAVVVPVRAQINHTQRGAIARTGAWQRWLTPGGRLNDQIDFGDAAGSRPMSWMLDPAVPDAVQQLAQGNLTRSVAPTVPTGEDDEEPSASASDGTGEGEETEEEATSPPDEPSAVAARAWLADALSSLRGDEVLELPYGDVDVAAAAKHAPELYGLARERRGAVVAQWGLPTSPVVASPSGFIDEDGLTAIDDDALVLATDRMFPEEDFPDGVPDVPRIEGQRVGVTSYGAARGGPGPDPRRAPVALRQRLLSEAAVRLVGEPTDAAGEPAPLIVVAPTTVDATGAEQFWSGLDEDWIDLTTVSDAVSGTATTVDPELLPYPRRQDSLEIDASQFSLARRIINRGGTLQQMLTLNDTIAGRLTDEALSGVSYSQRLARTPGQLDETLGWVERRLHAITVAAPPGVSLSSDSGSFVVTLTNNLNEPVTVQVDTSSEAGATTATVDPVDIPPGTRTTIELEVHTVAAGVDNLTIGVTDSTGERLGDTATVPVRPGQISTVIWWIIGSGAGILFVAIAIRLVRRFRRRHVQPDPEPAAEPTP